MSPGERDEYLRVFSEPGALTAALNWYRALPVSRRSVAGRSLDVERPTLFLWGNQDPAVGRTSIEAQRRYMKGPFREVELGAGHFLMEEQGPRVIAEVLAQWSSANAAPTGAPPS